MAKITKPQDKLKSLIITTFFLVIFFQTLGFIIAAVVWYFSYQKEIKHFFEQQNIQINLPEFPQISKPSVKSDVDMNQINNLFNKETMNKLGKIFIIAIVLVFGLMAVTSAFAVIENGTVGVITRFGQVQEKVMNPGLNFKIPFADRVLVYNTKKIIYETSQYPADSMADYTDYPIDTTTEDGQQIQVTYSVRFSVNPDKAMWLANNLGTEDQIVEKIVKTDTRINTRNVPRQYKAIDLYTGNIEEVSIQIANELRPVFEENGLFLDDFGVRNVIFSSEYVEAIESKQIEAEKIVTEQNIAEQEKFKKLAVITRAEGEAEAQRLQQETLTAELLQKLWIEKWNGQLPTYQGEGTPLISIPK